jgi:hypothetical protein
LKENLLWVRRFDTVEELRLALLAFRQTYNQSWIIERHGYRTPAQVRAEQTTVLPMAGSSYCVISVRRLDLVERCWCRAADSKGSGVDGEPRRS